MGVHVLQNFSVHTAFAVQQKPSLTKPKLQTFHSVISSKWVRGGGGRAELQAARSWELAAVQLFAAKIVTSNSPHPSG